MYKVGLTGGIGSGKSKVAEMLAKWGAAVIDTDVIAHELTAPGGAAIEPIRRAFGPDVIAENGALDRPAMRELVFQSPEARRRLEAILHPMIRAETEARARVADGCYVVFVVPLLVESGRWLDELDRVCVVDCDPETQIARVQARSGLTHDAIARIMSAQASREERNAAAHDLINNGGGTSLDELEHQVRALHERWCRSF
ncbi:dephospho-CoA kinase [Yanghanlia caeni]|uniref:Dephospho-CoA kinase n=1 Tax=Yanghanlia caeni TaxID=3064283 RepID=A0ABU1D6T8_9BURK|nr:dephospho-CoA kinase [Alcaligenaceae bacterium LG-2]NGR07680.1 dephospho-CoA kinase [bacterium SGD-2]HZH56944.1 dephospho-CoA kinase [Burkholderiaceae bacterium]